MLITVFHNVARECRYCGAPVTDTPTADGLLDGVVRTIGVDIYTDPFTCPDGRKHSVALANFAGYKPGQPLVPVFEYDEPCSSPAMARAEHAYMLFNIGDERGFPTALAYRARKLRSLSVGDVVKAGDEYLACASIGFEPIDTPTNILTEWPEVTVTVIVTA